MTIYYILRDRIPFFLTLIYLFRKEISEKLRSPVWFDAFGYYLIVITWILLGISGYLLFIGKTLLPLVGFNWSFPSPIEWGLLILIGTRKLNEEKGISLFESYYLSFLSSLGGGWIYEILYGIPYWVKSGFAYWNFLKFNLSKAFFFEFQIFALPIVVYILRSKYNYRFQLKTVIIGMLAVCFYLNGINIAPYFHKMGTLGGNTVFSWIMRIPVVVFLYDMINGVERIE